MKSILLGKLPLVLVGVLVGLLALALVPAPNRQESRASVSLVINLPVAQVWAVISDLAHADNYVPHVERITLEPGSERGVSASRRVFNTDGSWLDETVTQWQDGEGFALRLHKEDAVLFPFSKASFEYNLQVLSPQATAAHLSLVYRPRYGLLGQLLDGLLLNGIVEQQVMGVALGLKRYCDGIDNQVAFRWMP